MTQRAEHAPKLAQALAHLTSSPSSGTRWEEVSQRDGTGGSSAPDGPAVAHCLVRHSQSSAITTRRKKCT